MPILLFRILMFTCVPAGIFILVKAIQMLKKTFNGKMIAEIPFTQKQTKFQVPSKGIYAIWQKGQLFRKTPVGEFKLRMIEEMTGEEIQLKPTWFRVNSNGWDTGRTELKKFSANVGNFTLEIIKESDGYQLEKILTDILPVKAVNEDQYFIQIRESQPIYYIVLAIPMLAFSGLMMIGGFVGGLGGADFATAFGIPII